MRAGCHNKAFFKSVKTELLYNRAVFQIRRDAQREVPSYIEGLYNRIRRNSSIGYLAPVEFEKRHHAAKLKVYFLGEVQFSSQTAQFVYSFQCLLAAFAIV
ncbi:MAG: IS3 family transposase [Calditrichia bacterium]